MNLSRFFKPPPARRLLAVGYATLLTVLLVQSSARPVIGPSAPEDFNLLWEICLVIGHIVGFGLLVITIWWALLPGMTSPGSLAVGVIFALILGVISEYMQTLVPDRSGSLFDLAVDWGVTLGIAYLLQSGQYRPLLAALFKVEW